MTNPAFHPALDAIDVVVFDKDGTLISFDAMWAGWARSLGTRLELATRRPVAGDVFATIGFDPTTGRILPDGPLAVATTTAIQERIGAVLRRWCPSVSAARRILAEAWFEPDPVDGLEPVADVGFVFRVVAASGRRIAVATTDDRDPTVRTMAALGIADLVEALACGDDDGPIKPDPAVIAGIAAALGADPGRIAMVGDTPADLRMARAAGALAIGVLSGVSTAADLRGEGHLILATIADLVVSDR